jgi:hypothetical protein
VEGDLITISARPPLFQSALRPREILIGEVLYGNVGATDRLDFTVVGPAVNEAARIEALSEPLGRSILVSSEFAVRRWAARAGLSLLAAMRFAASRSRRRFSHWSWAAKIAARVSAELRTPWAVRLGEEWRSPCAGLQSRQARESCVQ